MSAPPSFDRYTARARKVLDRALREALSLGHNYIGTEHILLAMAREPEGVGPRVLERHGLYANVVSADVLEALRGGCAWAPDPDAEGTGLKSRVTVSDGGSFVTTLNAPPPDRRLVIAGAALALGLWFERRARRQHNLSRYQFESAF